MHRRWFWLTLCLVGSTGVLAADGPQAGSAVAPQWTIYIVNDNCPDYTWGLTEEQTRQAFADVVKGHLDEMTRTDQEPRESRDCYNAAVTQELLCFIERYPDRKAELARRIRQRRVYVSPYLCNTLWAFQGVEGALRGFYPARRLERELDLQLDSAHHIELPSLPWGTATMLAGCGIKRLSVPFYKYDSTFAGLQTPPLFWHQGPDGSRVLVAMDRFACLKASYMQGAKVLGKPEAIGREWIEHYASLGDGYPLRAILASGTHGDIAPRSGEQARAFAEKIIRYNRQPNRDAKLINATLPQFWAAVEAQESKKPWLPTVAGDFGHSWDLWPVSLAKYAADMREGERSMLAAETLLAMATHRDPKLHDATRALRERAEWCWAMLADHAWNGTNEANKRHNATLRRRWGAELNQIAGDLRREAWSALHVERNRTDLTLFNSLSFPRRGLVCVDGVTEAVAALSDGREIPCQIVEEGNHKSLCFVSPEVPGFGWQSVSIHAGVAHSAVSGKLTANADHLESPWYRATLDRRTGALGSLIHRPTGVELLAAKGGRGLGQTVYFDGQDHLLANVRSEVASLGPVLARLKIQGSTTQGIKVATLVTVYADLDQVDFDVQIHKPVSTREERLCQVFPIVPNGGTLRIATPGAVIRPRTQPEGDLLPGADTRRFAVQEFLDASSPRFGVTLVPLDAFALRMDLDPLSIEALGNDQNYKEVVKDQDGVTDFRFRYSLRAHSGGFDACRSTAFSRSAATPLLATLGRMQVPDGNAPAVTVDPARAIATCLKPADGPSSGGTVLRIWETAGRSGPLTIGVKGFRGAVRTDLLERNQEELMVTADRVTVDLKAHGFCGVRLVP